MKVLHTISGMNRGSGGPTTCTYNLVRGLRGIGVDTKILTLAPANNGEQYICDEDFIVAVKNDAANPFVYSRNFRDYLRTDTGYDIYHANGLWTYPSHITAKQARNTKKKYIIAPHGMLYPAGLQSKPWKKRIALAMFQRYDIENADAIQATCRQEAGYIAALGYKNPIAVVPNSIDISGYLPVRTETNKKRRFGFVGRIHPIKNIDIILEAWNSLGNKTSECELVIVGEGDETYKKALLEYTQKHNLKNVIFTGFLAGDELTACIRSFDYLLLASKSENFGMVVPEALVNGVPCIATEHTPWEELNSSRCGWWINDGTEPLRAAICEAIGLSEKERQEMGIRGIELVKTNYSVEAVAKKMRELYGWILKGREKPEFIY